MRRGSKTLAGAFVVFLLVVGLSACGGGSDGGSSSTEATAQSGSEGPGGSSAQHEAGGGAAGAGGGGGGGGGEGSADRRREAAEFVPRQHHDSGGGSAQFKVEGGDNSVQEFGEEAAREELDAAATALHGFLDARAEGNWAAACGYVSRSTVESFAKLAPAAKQAGGGGCAGILEKLINPAAKAALQAEAKRANVGSLRVEGDRAFVIYTSGRGNVLAMPMAQEKGGEWKVASLGGTPLQ